VLGLGLVLYLIIPLTILPTFLSWADLLLEVIIAALNLWASVFCSADDTFVWAGMHVPCKALDRWTLGGCPRGRSLVTLLDEDHPQAPGHYIVIAFFCAAPRMSPPTVSPFVQMASLKAAELVLLFLYWHRRSPGRSRRGGPFFPWVALGK